VPKQAVAGTQRVKVKIEPVAQPQHYMLDTVQPLTDIYRFTVVSGKRFQLRKKIRLKMAYPMANADQDKVIKYWDSQHDRWRRVKTSADQPTALAISTRLQKKQAIVAVFPKPIASEVVQGVASWYDWTGAACNAFPLGSIIRVTNVATGASVDSEVVSTGPFISGRVVDLPRDQFSQIADLSAGLAEVTVERIQ
jgi:rare lipoprotein A (peptidoglycan hydrolase)